MCFLFLYHCEIVIFQSLTTAKQQNTRDESITRAFVLLYLASVYDQSRFQSSSYGYRVSLFVEETTWISLFALHTFTLSIISFY